MHQTAFVNFGLRVAEERPEAENLQYHSDHNPETVDGLSNLFGLIQSKLCIWPAVVGIRNGTGDVPHRYTRYANPPTNTRKAT